MCITTLVSPPLPVWMFAAGHLSSQARPPAAAGEGQTPGTPPQPTASPWRAGASSAGCGTCFLLAPRPFLHPHNDKHKTSLMLSVSLLAGWSTRADRWPHRAGSGGLWPCHLPRAAGREHAGSTPPAQGPPQAAFLLTPPLLRRTLCSHLQQTQPRARLLLSRAGHCQLYQKVSERARGLSGVLRGFSRGVRQLPVHLQKTCVRLSPQC